MVDGVPVAAAVVTLNTANQWERFEGERECSARRGRSVVEMKPTLDILAET